MTLPGHKVTIADRAPARIADAATGAWFVVGRTERGSHLEPTLCRSLAQFVTRCGDRYTGDPTLYDAAETYFREGGSILYVGRVVGDTPVAASDTLAAAVGTAMTIEAASVGEWGNDVDVVADADVTTFTLEVQHMGATVLLSPTLATVAEAVAWAEDQASDWIVITDEGGGDPVDGTADLAGGDDDDATIGDDNWVTALALFTDDYGPGQVSAPGRTTAQGHEDVLAHTDVHHRVALLDPADTDDVPTLTAASTGQRGNAGARWGGLFTPWATIPGLTRGTTREVPYSAVQAGLIARSDAKGNNPNLAAAGDNGRARFANGLTQVFSDADRETLNDAGVNVAVLKRNEVRTMGDRTFVNPLTDPNWVPLSNSRLVMGVAHKAGRVMERFEFAQIDGRGLKVKELHGSLSGEACMPYYLAGALYGANPEDAFAVNVGADVNTPESIAEQKLRAVITLRVSPRGEIVETEIVRVGVTEAVV